MYERKEWEKLHRQVYDDLVRDGIPGAEANLLANLQMSGTLKG